MSTQGIGRGTSSNKTKKNNGAGLYVCMYGSLNNDLVEGGGWQTPHYMSYSYTHSRPLAVCVPGVGEWTSWCFDAGRLKGWGSVRPGRLNMALNLPHAFPNTSSSRNQRRFGLLSHQLHESDACRDASRYFSTRFCTLTPWSGLHRRDTSPRRLPQGGKAVTIS